MITNEIGNLSGNQGTRRSQLKEIDSQERNITAIQAGDKGNQTVEYSEMSEMLMKYDVSDYSFSGNSSQMVFSSKNGDVRLQSTSVLNVSSHIENIELEISLPAEILNFDPSIFEKNGNQPLQMEFSFSFTQKKIEYFSNLSIQKTNRTPQEVIGDLAKALYSVANKRGNKSIGISLDVEALQSLLGSEKSAALMEKIAALIGLINSLRKMDEESKHYQIFVSGKGPTSVNFYQKADVSVENMNVNLKINIQPPVQVSAEIEGPDEAPAEVPNEVLAEG